jgi:hypothetical protein
MDSEIYAYLSAFLPKWWALASAGALFGIDEFAKAHWPWLKQILDRVPEQRRKQAELLALITAIFFSGFSAWHDEYAARLTAERHLSERGPTSAELTEIRSLQLELSDTKRRLDEALNPPRDADGLYRSGQKVGKTSGSHIDFKSNLVIFDIVTVEGAIDPAINLEYKDLIIQFVEYSAFSQQRRGLDVTSSYQLAKFNIVGTRSH